MPVKCNGSRKDKETQFGEQLSWERGNGWILWHLQPDIVAPPLMCFSIRLQKKGFLCKNTRQFSWKMTLKLKSQYSPLWTAGTEHMISFSVTKRSKGYMEKHHSFSVMDISVFPFIVAKGTMLAVFGNTSTPAHFYTTLRCVGTVSCEKVNIRPYWHINARRPLRSYLKSLLRRSRRKLWWNGVASPRPEIWILQMLRGHNRLRQILPLKYHLPFSLGENSRLSGNFQEGM